MSRAPPLLCIVLVTACGQSSQHATKPPAVATKPVQPPGRATPQSIGSAKMDADGTITLRLSVNEPGMVGDGIRAYRKDDPQYGYILKHIGPLKPGQSVPVKPFPD